MTTTMNLLFMLILPLTTTSFTTRSLSRAYTSIGISQTQSLFGASYKVNHQHQTQFHVHQRQSIRRFMSASEDKGVMAGKKMKILGVCGGIGSGKSHACELMVDSLGCVARIDADKLAHIVYEPGSKSLEEIVSEFGKDILDEADNTQIDRKKLGAIVFNDAKAMSKLEHIVWPHVRNKIEERIDEIKSEQSTERTTPNNNIIIVEAALLLETNWHDLLDGLWVVQSSPSVATRRLQEHRGMTEEEALVRIKAQESRRGIGGSSTDDSGISDKLRQEMDRGVVTAVITNDGSLADLEKSLEKALSDPASFKKHIDCKL